MPGALNSGYDAERMAVVSDYLRHLIEVLTSEIAALRGQAAPRTRGKRSQDHV